MAMLINDGRLFNFTGDCLIVNATFFNWQSQLSMPLFVNATFFNWLQVFERAPKSTIVFFLERFYINTGLANNPLYDDLANNPGLHPLWWNSWINFKQNLSSQDKAHHKMSWWNSSQYILYILFERISFPTLTLPKTINN